MFKLKAPQSSEKPRSSWFSLVGHRITQFFQHVEAYRYDPLPPKDYIRYLVLEPGKDQDPLVCNLHIAPLTELPYLEAISYVWGDSKKVAQVSCAGQTLRITAALRNVLRSVRLPDTQRTLWADSICIYPGRHRTKYRRNLRVEPPFYKGVGFNAFSVPSRKGL